MNIANIVTCSRVLLIPVVIALYYSSIPHAAILAAIVFAIASLTDWLDGYLARKLKQTSPFGAFLDPVADKLYLCRHCANGWPTATSVILWPSAISAR